MFRGCCAALQYPCSSTVMLQGAAAGGSAAPLAAFSSSSSSAQGRWLRLQCGGLVMFRVFLLYVVLIWAVALRGCGWLHRGVGVRGC